MHGAFRGADPKIDLGRSERTPRRDGYRTMVRDLHGDGGDQAFSTQCIDETARARDGGEEAEPSAGDASDVVPRRPCIHRDDLVRVCEERGWRRRIERIDGEDGDGGTLRTELQRTVE